LSLNDYLRILLRRGWIMIALAIIAGATAYFLSRGQTPVYRASQIVLIEPSRADLGLAEATRTLTEPLTVVLNSEQRAQEIVNNLNLHMTAGELLANTTFASDQFRLTIQIDVTSTDPGEAAAIARAWGQQLVDYRNERNQLARREDRVFANMTDVARAGQIAPRPTFNAIAGALVGLLAGGVIVFVLEYLEAGIIRGRRDLGDDGNMYVLASIPHADR
jgi:capsular polysaccharide biosynthesis protein